MRVHCGSGLRGVNIRAILVAWLEAFGEACQVGRNTGTLAVGEAIRTALSVVADDDNWSWRLDGGRASGIALFLTSRKADAHLEMTRKFTARHTCRTERSSRFDFEHLSITDEPKRRGEDYSENGRTQHHCLSLSIMRSVFSSGKHPLL
ncbi:hypothetical protein AB6A40_007335 [Gnathostoma spinigerum]|uniref:Uncharacterized protein n=1 Tax=Gnathostoma spinigerum TaxID=75299 RepID=A0ABD6EMX0_9BILA